MTQYLGDFESQQTVRFGWTTNDGSGAGATRSVNGTISVYKDGNVVQSTAGVTDTEDFDSITGVHLVTIVTTDAFYAIGSDYMVVLSGATVDGISPVVAVLAHFSIENRPTNVNRLDGDAQSLTDLKDFADAGYDPGTNKVEGVKLVDTTTTNTDMRGTDGVDTAPMRGTDNAFLAASAPTNFSAMLINASGHVSRVTLVDTTTVNSDMRGTDGAATPGDAMALTTGAVDDVWDEAQAGHTTAGTFGKFLDVEVSSVSGGGGLTQQQVRDAMKLTPTAGAPSTGSVDEHLDDIDGKTTNLPPSPAATGDAMDLVANAIDAASIDTTGGNAFADYTLRRSLATALSSAVGDAKAFRSLAGAVAKLVDRVRSNAGTLEIYEPDDTTILGTQTITTSASAEPVTEVDTV